GNALLAVFVALLSILLLRVHFYGNGDAPQYIAIVDAGSSGSRLLVYSRRAGQLKQHCIHAIEPGLGFFVHALDDAAQSVLNLTREAEGCILGVDASVDSIPLYLFATGGLRSMLEEERDALLRSVYSRVQQESGLFHVVSNVSGVLTG
ncbi:hypothetical protein WA577_002482, partial [Blastocystis sp. JDR]